MVTSVDIEKIYFNYENKFINEKTCVDKLIRLVISGKHFFGLEKLNDDTIFDYLFFVYPKIFDCLERFDKKKSKFSTYFQTLIRMEYLTWKKNKLKENLKNQVLQKYNQQEYTQNEENYLLVSEDAREIEYTKKMKEKKGNNIFKSDFFLQPKGKNELYVIILKCVDYLTSEQIHKLTKYYSLDFNELCFYIEQAKEFIAEKKFQIEKYKELTNKTFVKREQLKLGLSKLEENSSAYINFYNDYIKICKLYAKRKEKLKKMKAIPSDKEVGKILGIPATNVRYILQKYYDILNIDKNSSSK